MNLNKETTDWLNDFAEFHRLGTREEAIYKLIEVHKAWNQKVLDAVSMN